MLLGASGCSEDAFKAVTKRVAWTNAPAMSLPASRRRAGTGNVDWRSAERRILCRCCEAGSQGRNPGALDDDFPTAAAVR